MNRKGIAFFTILVAILSVSFSTEAYENRQYEDVVGGTHRQINKRGIDKFIDKAKNDPIMSKYNFEPSAGKLEIKPLNSFVTQYELKKLFLPPGYYVTYPGDWKADVRDDVVFDRSFKQWVIDGGYTADEPERYMSLRHFYTPTGDREAYLTDIPSGGWVKMGDNPQIDAKTWALSHEDNKYSWNSGLKELKFGFISGTGKDCYSFAAAWRSLGETMHLIADMTTPAHVRNDSHPGNYTAAVLVDDLRSDPYEYMTGHDAALLTEAFNNPINNPALLNVINKKQEPKDIFDEVAKYVNKNFFSADTIPFSNPKFIKGTTRDEKGYLSGNGSVFASPNPFDYTEDANGNYIANIPPESGSNEPLIGYHTSWLNVNGWDDEVPVVTRTAVLSQAKRLIPLAINSTTKLADLFMPRVRLNYTGIDFEKKVIKGEFLVYKRGADGSYKEVDTSIGDMYQKPLVYVQIKEKDAPAKDYVYLASPVRITNNKFEIPLRDLDESCKLYTYLKTGGQKVVDKGTDDTTQPEISISLGIDMGGILVKSGVAENLSDDCTCGLHKDYSGLEKRIAKDGDYSAFYKKVPFDFKGSSVGYWVDKKTGKLEGILKANYQGKVRLAGCLHNDMMNGKWQLFFDDGKMWQEMYYADGDLQPGKNLTSWYQNGKIQSVACFDAAQQKDGTWTIYYENGTKKSVDVYEHGNCISSAMWDESGSPIDLTKPAVGTNPLSELKPSTDVVKP